MKIYTLPILLTLACGNMAAQEGSKLSFNVGAGFTQSVGATSANLEGTGYNIHGGAGYKFRPNVGVNLDLGFDSFGIRNSVLQTVGAPGGNVNVFTATVNPIVHVTPRHRADVYFTGGGGYFRQYQQFTAPTIATTAAYNPFFGFYPVNVAATQVLASSSVNKPGFDAGAGVSFGTRWHGKIFAEARYYHMFNTNTHTDFVPVTFGFRW